MARFLMYDGAAIVPTQVSVVYTITEDHFCCEGVEKAIDIVGMETAPDTARVMSRLTKSTVIVTVDHELSGWASVEMMIASLPNAAPDAMMLAISFNG